MEGFMDDSYKVLDSDSSSMDMKFQFVVDNDAHAVLCRFNVSLCDFM